MEELLEEIREVHMMKHIGKYTVNINPSIGLDAEDIKQIFLIGCYEAIPKANPDIGNPLLYIIQCGKWRVQSAFQREYRKYKLLKGSLDQVPIDDAEYYDPTDEMFIQEFAANLGGRKAEIFNLIYYKGFDRDGCKNYLQEVADELGISQANVNNRRKQIMEEWIAATA